MPNKYYKEKLTHKEIIKLFDDGKYLADLDTGKVLSARTWKPLFKFTCRDANSIEFVRLYAKGKFRAIPISHIIWLLGNRIPIPKGFQIHHRNRNPKDNSFKNLFALYKTDHLKLHQNDLIGDDF